MKCAASGATSSTGLRKIPAPPTVILDWSMKLSLYTDQAAKLGIRWDRLTFWNEIVNRLNAALKEANCGENDVTLDFVIGPHSPVPNEVERLTKFLQSKGLDWNELQKLLNARQRFFEIDTRFGQLGPKGIFQSLDAAGVLNHRINNDESNSTAMSEPPATGRARIRGQVDSPPGSRARGVALRLAVHHSFLGWPDA